MYLKAFGLVLLGLGLLLICGCERMQAVIPPEPSDGIGNTPLRVTMVYPSDCVGTSAYCDGFHTGVTAAEEKLGIILSEVNGMESEPVTTERVVRAAAQNSDLVLAASYQFSAVIVRVAPEFPDVQFAIFDAIVDIPNVASVNYKSNGGSFLVGAIAALKSESGKIGFIGAVDAPLVHEFEAGYIAGIQTINPDADISVEYISEDVTGFVQPDKAKTMALAQYANGVDVIYAPAGSSAQGILEAAQQQQKYIIWVDSNGNHLAPGVVLTSMAKELPASVQRIIRETVEGNFIAGPRYFGLENGGVYYAVDEHNRSLLSDDIIATVESLKAKIIAGEIVVPDTISLPRE